MDDEIPSYKIRKKWQKNNMMRGEMLRLKSSEEWQWWMVCETTHVCFHKYKVHVRADTWDGGKCLCGLVVNRGRSRVQAWVRGEGEGGLGIPWYFDSLRSWGWTGLAQWAFWPRPPGRPCGKPWWVPAWQSGTLWLPAWLHGRSWAWASWSTGWTTANKKTDKSK